MKSNIRVEYDLLRKEPYIQIRPKGYMPDEEQPDLRDQVFKEFTTQANNTPIALVYQPNPDTPDDFQLRIIKADSEMSHQTCLLGCFENYSRDLIKKHFQSVEQEPMKVFSRFFDLMYDLTEPHLKGDVGKPTVQTKRLKDIRYRLEMLPQEARIKAFEWAAANLDREYILATTAINTDYAMASLIPASQWDKESVYWRPIIEEADKEFNLLYKIDNMCAESLDPDTHDKWEDVKRMLCDNRHML